MNRPRRSPLALSGAVLLAIALAPALDAASIPKLYNTGVNDAGALLGANQVDPHYTVVQSPDTRYPGPDAKTLEPGYPVGPWMPEGPKSRWIAPNPTGASLEPGQYVYKTTFDLTGYNPAAARIYGKWAVDDGGLDILINGVNWGATAVGFGGFTEFLIDAGFVEGVNTLEFLVNNGGAAANPSGLRVELIGLVEAPGQAPVIVQGPADQTALAGADVTFTVIADGTGPLTYEWFLGTTKIADATTSTLLRQAVSPSDAGTYKVKVTNALGSAEATATLTLLSPIPGLFNTGVKNDGTVADDSTAEVPVVDLHYTLVTNADDPESQDALVHDPTVWPIVEGPWVANSDLSKWIGPRANPGAGAAGGAYIYRLNVDLTGFDPATAFITGSWAVDDSCDLLLNDLSVVKATHGFDSLAAFEIRSGFISGMNRLDFAVANGSAGPTGLRVENLSGFAKPGAGSGPPRILSQPQGYNAVTGESWTFTVAADSLTPITYKWFRSGVELAGKTDKTLALSNLKPADAGEYVAVLKNAIGETSTQPAVLTVLERIPGIYGTGVDDTGALLEPGTVDLHYTLTVSADPNFPGPDAVTLTAGPFPTWIVDGPNSRWIAPNPDQSSTQTAPGLYTYQTSFTLQGVDVAQVRLIGRLASDDGLTQTRLNGEIVGGMPGGGFGGLVDFQIGTGFKTGVNTLDFDVTNGGDAVNPSGFRLDLKGGIPPVVVQQPTLGVAKVAGKIKLSWPVAATGFQLYGTPSLGTPAWAAVNTPVVVEGDQNTVTVDAAGAAGYFRLQNAGAKELGRPCTPIDRETPLRRLPSAMPLVQPPQSGLRFGHDCG